MITRTCRFSPFNRRGVVPETDIQFYLSCEHDYVPFPYVSNRLITGNGEVVTYITTHRQDTRPTSTSLRRGRISGSAGSNASFPFNLKNIEDSKINFKLYIDGGLIDVVVKNKTSIEEVDSEISYNLDFIALLKKEVADQIITENVAKTVEYKDIILLVNKDVSNYGRSLIKKEYSHPDIDVIYTSKINSMIFKTVDAVDNMIIKFGKMKWQ